MLARDFLVTVVAYGLAAFASLAFKMPGTNVSLVWLPAGVAVVAMWLRGPWLWTAVAVGELVIAVLEGGNPPATVARLIVANVATPLVVLAVLRRLRADPGLGRFGDAAAFIGAAALGTLAGSALNAVLRLAERGLRGDELTRALNWWLGDATGILVLAPVALTWGARALVPESRRESLALAALLAVAPVVTLVAFPHGPAVLVSVLYLVLPVQLWAAVRLGPRGGAQALAIVAGGVLIASVTTLRAPGVDTRTSLVLLDGFLLVSATATIVVGALVADLKRTASALADARRLETVRRLAGGIAHDFHNLLTVILGNVDLLRIERTREAVEGDLEEIRRAAARAATITQQLLAYGQQALLRPTLFDVNPLVREVEATGPALYGEDVTLRVALAEGLPPVHTDRDQLGRVLGQLCHRAAVAMPDGGTITVTTAAAKLVRKAGPVPAVEIRIEDGGTPIEPGRPEAALEPYAGPLPTGEARRRSSGMELAMADGFVRQVGGTIRVDSAAGRGTTVILVLPAAAPAA